MKKWFLRLWPLVATVIIIGLAVCEYARAADAPISYNKTQPQERLAWNGLYLGLFVGYGWGDGTSTLNSITCPDCNTSKLANINSNFPITGPDTRMDGAVLGGQIGYDWQQGRWVLGVVDDLSWSGIKGTTQVMGYLQASSRVTWMNNLDLRAGYLITPTTLIYAIGGLTTAGVKSTISPALSSASWVCLPTDSFCSGGNSDTKWGWNAGLGIEGRMSKSTSVFVDARYFKLPDSNPTSPGFICDNPAVANISQKNEFGVFRVGLNWRPNQ